MPEVIDNRQENLLPQSQVFAMHNRKKLWLAIVIALVTLSIPFILYFVRGGKIGNASLVASIPGVVTPTPFPFQELTIPYLRNREYKSSLGDLSLVSENGSYLSYLASYDSDGYQVNGLLLVPTIEQPPGGFPAIVFIHGYIQPTQYQTLENYTSYIDYLASNGFVVFKIDLRGHAQSEGEAGGGYYSADYIIDTLNARAALQSSDFVDPERSRRVDPGKIGLWGHSMAGNVVLRSMAARPDIPASVIWAGAVYTYEDQRKYGINDNSYRPPSNKPQRIRRRQELFDKYGSPSAQSVFWQQVAPTNYLSDLEGAIQINHAIDDDVVNIGYSRDLIELLDKTSVPHELHEYPFGGHNISGVSFNEAMQETVSFFQKYLP
ncbi:MAG: alpha/beta fold hydrolase [Candidatus Levybacteria bacterium]|nr:alpha/beta fold hydrolase [Candidatus Levybacteria bacterium]